MLNFNFLEKDLENFSPLYFVYDFSRHIFLMLSSTDWPIFITWLTLSLSNQAVFLYEKKGYYKPCHHPPPSTTTHHHPPQPKK